MCCPGSARLPILLLLGAVGAQLAAAAAPFRVVLHPSAPSGIKSIATLADGQVFLATSAGLFRFERVRHVPVLPLPASLNMMMASSDGRHLWVSSQTGLLRFDTVKHSARQVLQQPMWGLAEVADRVFARTSEKEAFAVDPTLQEPPRQFACARAEFVHTGLSTHGWASSPNASYRLDPASLAQYPVAGLPPEYRFAFPDGSGRVWTLHADGARAWQDGRQVAFVSARPQQSNPFTAGRNGQVWFATDRTVLGLNPPVELPLQYELKPNGRVAVHEDARGHVWVGNDSGQLWEVIPDATWEQWSLADLAPGATPVQLFRNPQGQLILVTEKTLYRLDETARRWQALAPEPHHFQFVLPLADGGLLASTDDAALLRLDAAGKRVGPAAPKVADPFLLRGFRALAQLPGPAGAVAVGNRNALLHWDPAANALQLVATPGVENPGRRLPDVPTYPNAVDFAPDHKGRLWMGYTPGLAVWDPAASAWQRLATEPPVEKVRSFTFGRDNTEIWVAHRDTGYFSRVHNGRVTRFAAADGYEPGKTFFLKRDRRGWIWRGTTDGVYVSDGRAAGPLDWIRLPASGESRIYGFFEDRDGSIWIAGVEGVAHLRPDAAWFRRHATPPSAPRVLADGREWRAGALPGSRLLRFEFSTHGLGYYNGAVQHRLLPRHADWRSAPQAHFEYADVAPGRYRLELRQAGYSGTLVRELVVGAQTAHSPLLLRSAWLFAGPLALFAGWLVVRREHVAYQIGKARMLLRHWWRQDPRGEHDPADLTGRVLKQRYRLLRPLSTGGFSQVYEAEDLEAGSARRLAVKLLFRRAGEGPWARDQFAKEVTAMQMAAHPGIVTLLDWWINPSGEPCLAMPLLEGPTLRERIVPGQRWEAPRAARLITHLADAVAALHAAGVIHRDLKPENIILLGADEDRPVIIDFGTSGLLGQGEPASTTRMLSGSLDYLAPERLLGSYSPATDTYALGAVAYELLTGERLSKTGGKPASPLLSPAVGELLEAATHPLPERRPAGCREWAAQLSAAL